MADEDAQGAPEGTEDSGNGTDGTTEAPQGDATATPPAGEGWDPERAMRTIRTLRDEVKALKRQHAESATTGDPPKQDDAAGDAAIQAARAQVERERAAIAADRRRLDVERVVLTAAPAAGITDVTLALAVIDPEDIEFDEGGGSNVKDVLAALIQRHPVLKAQSAPAGPPSTDARKGRSQPDGPKLTAEQMAAAQAMGMTPEDYARYLKVNTAADHAALSAARNGKE